MTRLLDPKWLCPICGAALEELGGEVDASPADGAEAWRASVTLQTISCSAGHAYEAQYAEVRPWLSRLAGFGARVA